jgi:hypothetical protein
MTKISRLALSREKYEQGYLVARGDERILTVSLDKFRTQLVGVSVVNLSNSFSFLFKSFFDHIAGVIAQTPFVFAVLHPAFLDARPSQLAHRARKGDSNGFQATHGELGFSLRADCYVRV